MAAGSARPRTDPAQAPRETTQYRGAGGVLPAGGCCRSPAVSASIGGSARRGFKNYNPVVQTLVTGALCPDVPFVRLVITLGHQFTLSSRILEWFVVAFAKCVFVPCAACF